MGTAELILFIAVLGAIAIMLPSVVGIQHQAFTAQVAQVEAGQLAHVTDAALEYEYGNMASLDAPNSTHTVSVATLIAQGFLTAGTSAIDAFGNPISVQFTTDGSGNVTGYVVAQGTYQFLDRDAGQIIRDLGDRGGYVPLNLLAGQQAGVIYGSGDTWHNPAPAGINPGSIDVKVEPNAAQEADDSRFLWRVPAPDAADNSMSTPLIMSAVESPGASCANNGAIAQDGTGALVSCQSGTWQEVGGGHWKSPVSTYPALPASGNQDGDVRLALDTDRAFAWNGAWVPLAVDQNGDLTVPRHLSAENGQVSTNTGCSGDAGMQIGGVQIWTDPNCGPGDTGIYFQNPGGYAYQFADQGDFMTIWGPGVGSIFKAHENGEWDSEEGGFVLNGNGNGSEEGNAGWGFQPRYASGWSMVTSVNGGLNAQPQSALGSIHANDYFDRATGWWLSQAVNQIEANTNNISSLQSTVATQGSEISSINGNLNQGPCSTGYNSIATLCNEFNSAMDNVQDLGKPENCSGGITGSPTQCGPVGPSSVGYWGWCGWGWYRYRCWQSYESPPAANLPTEAYPQLVVAVATAGIGQGGCGVNGNTGVLTLTATSGGAQLAQSAQYNKGGSNYNPNDIYFPFSITFVLPAGQSGQIQLTGGENNLGCGSFMYSLYAL